MNSKRFWPTNNGVKSEKGVTLIEVIISIGILGIIGAAIVTYFTWSIGVFNYTNVKATEESLARTRMEQIKSDNWSDTFSYGPSIQKSGAYVVSYTGDDVPGQSGLQLITVVASRTYIQSQGNKRSDNVTLQGYKGDR